MIIIPPKKRGRKPGTPKTPGSGARKGQKFGGPSAIRKANAVLEAARGVTKSKRYKAYERLVSLAEEIDRDLSLAMAGLDKPEGATQGDILTIWELRDRLAEILGKLLPYEKPRLTAVKVSGDRKSPLFDLSSLSETELQFLRKTVLKSTQVQEESEEE